MSARKADRCRVCHEDRVVAIVKTSGGFSRVCADHVTAIENAVAVTLLPDAGPDLARYATAQNRTDLGNVLDDALAMVAARGAA